MEIDKIGISIWVTTRCNMNCTYCYEEHSNQQRDISTDNIKNIVQFLIMQGRRRKIYTYSITFHGGEPLLCYPWIVEFIEQVKEEKFFWDKEVRYEMTTNALLLNDSNIPYLSKNIHDISVSIDGTRESHDSMRVTKNGVGTYSKVIENSKRLLEWKPDINARMTVNTQNIECFQDNINHLIECGFLNIIPSVDIWDKNWNSDNVCYIEDCNNYINKYKILHSDFDGEIGQLVSENRSRLVCDGGESSFQISPEGDIYPCSFCVDDKRYKCGNVSYGLDEVAVKRVNEVKNMKIEECKGCSNYDSCISTRCKFVNEKYCGKPEHPIPLLCYLEHLKLSGNVC